MSYESYKNILKNVFMRLSINVCVCGCIHLEWIDNSPCNFLSQMVENEVN